MLGGVVRCQALDAAKVSAVTRTSEQWLQGATGAVSGRQLFVWMDVVRLFRRGPAPPQVLVGPGARPSGGVAWGQGRSSDCASWRLQLSPTCHVLAWGM